MLAEQVLKVAAKAPLKAAAGKMAGATASGSAAGALIGSVVPGAGTLVGALVGGVIVGIGVGVGVDAALLKAEEALSRDDFERALVTAIREARSELSNEYLGEPAENTSAGESVAGPSVVPADRSP